MKVCGEGEWKARQCGWSRRRTWRTFHVAVDTESGEVQAAMLSMAGVADAKMVEPMLAQIDQPIASVAADGGYDKRRVYTVLHARTPTPTRPRTRAMKLSALFEYMAVRCGKQNRVIINVLGLKRPCFDSKPSLAITLAPAC